ALRSAAVLLERATAIGRLAGPVVVERVRVLTLLGRAAEALDVGGAALGLVRGDQHAELCLRLARAAVVAGRWAVAEQFVERAGRPDDPRSLMLDADAAYGAGDVARAVRLGRAAVRAVERAGTASSQHAALLCEALTVLGRGMFGTDPAGSDKMLRRAAQVAAEHGLTPWRVEARAAGARLGHPHRLHRALGAATHRGRRPGPGSPRDPARTSVDESRGQPRRARIRRCDRGWPGRSRRRGGGRVCRGRRGDRAAALVEPAASAAGVGGRGRRSLGRPGAGAARRPRRARGRRRGELCSDLP
ncbi:MAG: hypothetical protein ACRDTZ_11275, partial [Pseudonocardiaceae bacterium]